MVVDPSRLCCSNNNFFTTREIAHWTEMSKSVLAKTVTGPAVTCGDLREVVPTQQVDRGTATSRRKVENFQLACGHRRELSGLAVV